MTPNDLGTTPALRSVFFASNPPRALKLGTWMLDEVCRHGSDRRFREFRLSRSLTRAQARSLTALAATNLMTLKGSVSF